MRKKYKFSMSICIYLLILLFCPILCFPASVEIISAPTMVPRDSNLVYEYSPGLEIGYNDLTENKIYTLKIWLLERGHWWCASTQYCEKVVSIDNTSGNSSEGVLYLNDTIDIYDYPTLDWLVRLYDGSTHLDKDEIYASGTANRSPRLNPIGDRITDLGQTLKFTVTATDPDGDQLSFQAANLPSGAEFNQATGLFIWTPSASGVYQNIKFRVIDDGEGNLYDTELISITVDPGSLTLEPTGNRKVCIGNTLEFILSAYDPSGNTLEFEVDDLPPGADFNTQTGHFYWTPDPNTPAGNYKVTFKVMNIHSEDSQTINIEVLEECPQYPYLAYLLSAEDPWIWVENELKDGQGGIIEAGLVRSFYDPNTIPGRDYTKLRKGGEQYALDTTKTPEGFRVISDSENLEPKTSGATPDGFEDGLGDASSLYDVAMTVICFTHAGRINEVRKILDLYSRKVFIMLDSNANSPDHPLDQGELFTAVPSDIIGISFDKYSDTGNIPGQFDPEDSRLTGYPRLAPGYEFGAYLWQGGGRLDDSLDMPRASEFNDNMDVDDPTPYFPYNEKGVFYRAFWPYTLFFRWIDLDTSVSEGSLGEAQRLLPDKVIGYSPLWEDNENKHRSYETSTGDDLWLVLSILYYTAQTEDARYLHVAYQIMDTIGDISFYNGDNLYRCINRS